MHRCRCGCRLFCLPDSMRESEPMRRKRALAAVSAEDVSQTLESASRWSMRHHINSGALRPCIGRIMDTPLYKGSFPNRNEAALMIACELYRCGKDDAKALEIVKVWNSRNIDPLLESEMKKAVRNAFTGKYNYSCKSTNMKEFCIGDSCPFASFQRGKHGKYFTNQDFVRYGWPRLLSNSAVLVYYVALPVLEKLMGLRPGGLITASQSRIARFAGITRKSARSGLQELARRGLITYKPGIPRRWEGKASEIRRVIPIPKQPKELLAGREK